MLTSNIADRCLGVFFPKMYFLQRAGQITKKMLDIHENLDFVNLKMCPTISSCNVNAKNIPDAFEPVSDLL